MGMSANAPGGNFTAGVDVVEAGLGVVEVVVVEADVPEGEAGAAFESETYQAAT